MRCNDLTLLEVMTNLLIWMILGKAKSRRIQICNIFAWGLIASNVF
jgi:hypothetical protein